MTIGGRRVKCQCCGRTAKVLAVNGTPICDHCFKAYALGLLIGRCVPIGHTTGTEEVWKKLFKDENKEEKE